MNISQWKIYNKAGSNLQWTAEPYISLIFDSETGVNAQGYLITDPSCHAISAKINNSGHSYIDNFNTYYSYIFNSTLVQLTSADASVYTKDISIFNPEITSTKGISSLTLNLSTNFIYPSVTYAAAIFMEPVSKGLIETEHLFIFEESSTGGFIRPYDASNFTLKFKMIGDDNEIKFFTLDENLSEITWTDELTFDTSIRVNNTPITLNIGFKAEKAGVYERIIRVYHQIDTSLHILADIAVSAEAIDEDERFRTLLSNFGAPDPIDFPKLFKEVDINEDLPDYKVINYKSKHMILEYDKIIPYIGTYKALINAIKWLGYDDIYVREWFKNVKENKKLSVVVSYDAADRTQTMLMFDANQRKVLKKLNQLSLNYCLTQETGENDIWGTPITENCYPYNIKEVFTKLLALKQWLERNIIGVNCRIIDITGEGVYFERFRNLVYTTDNIGYDYTVSQDLTPYSPDESSELIMGDASIRLTFLELTRKTIKDLPYSFIDFADYACYIYNPSICVALDDASYLADPSLYVLKGSVISYPFIDLRDIQWKLSVQKEHGVIGPELVTNPLFIYENDIRFYNIYDTSSVFYDASTNLSILLEDAYLRDPCIDEWTNSIAYSIYPNQNIYLNALETKTITYPGTYTITLGSGTIYKVDDTSVKFNNVVYNRKFTSLSYNSATSFIVDTCVYIVANTNTTITTPFTNYNYTMESSTGVKYLFDDYITFEPATNSRLEYAYDDNYKVPLLSFNNFSFIDSSNVTRTFGSKKYYLDILDGKISMNAGITPYQTNSDTHYIYINWNYDTSLDEQIISMNVEYYSPRIILAQIDASSYYWSDPSHLSGGGVHVMTFDNSIYIMHVNHVGDYNIELFAWDSYNTMFHNSTPDTYPVYTKYPTLYALIDARCNVKCVSTFINNMKSDINADEVSTLINSNLYPIYDRTIPLQGLTFLKDLNNQPYLSIPSITYFQDVPEPNSLNAFYNLTERAISISGNDIIIDVDYQKFYANDDIKLLKTNKGKYSLITEVSSHIVNVSGTTLTLDQIPSTINIDSSSEVYLLNDTYRTTVNAYNTDTNFITDVSGYAFNVNQLVGIIVTDGSTPNYSWGSSYRVSSINGSTHTFDNLLPAQFLSDVSKYTIQVKHAFSTYCYLTIPTYSATEVANNFKIYLDDSYCQEYYLDDTFVFANILFDQETVNERWYDPSLNLHYKTFYYHKRVDVDTSTLVILKAIYDSSTYMLNQKNIWTVSNHDSSTIVFRVFNQSVPYVYGETGIYDVKCVAYDSYGNAVTKKLEGLVIIE